MKFIALIDNSLKSGFGHVKRSYLLINSFIQKYNIDEIILFFEESPHDDTINLFNQFNLPKKISYYDQLDFQLTQFKKNDIEFFALIDSYKISDDLVKSLKDFSYLNKVLRILDKPTYSSADYIIDYNPLALNKWRNYNVNKSAKYLLGSKFFISDINFKEKTKENLNLNSDILICLGYSEQFKIIKDCLTSIENINGLNNKKIYVISKSSEKLKNLKWKKSFQRNIIFKTNVPNLLPYIEKTKLFITSSSTQMYEASYFSKPTICIELNKNQSNSSELYNELGLWFYIPNNELTSLKSSLGYFVKKIFSKYKRIVSYKWGSKNINFSGQEEIVRNIKSSSLNNDFSYKSKEKNEFNYPKIDTIKRDFKYMNEYLNLRNFHSTRKIMGNTKIIKRLEHYTWWLKKTSRESKLFVRNNQQKIVIWEESKKIDDEYFLIGGWFGSKYKRSFWDAYALVKKQLEECKLKYPNHTWLAIIHTDNKHVLKMNLNLGFEIIDTKINERYGKIFKKAFKINDISIFNKLIYKNSL